jgi:hypothetical protein
VANREIDDSVASRLRAPGSEKILEVELEAGRNAGPRSKGTNLGERLQKKETDQMISSKRISLALAALVLAVLAGLSSAVAQTTPLFDVTTAVPLVANTGRSEVLGQVVLTANINCTGALACVSTAGTIQVLYIGTPIDFTTFATGGVTCSVVPASTGIEVIESVAGATNCNQVGTLLAGGFTATNTSAGGLVSFTVKTGIDLNPGDQVVVRGVRGQIDQGPGNVVGSSISAQLTTSPSTIAGFNPVQQDVARSADPLTMSFAAWTVLQCQPSGSGTVTVTEGFNTAFVDSASNGAVVATPVDPFDTGATHTNLSYRPLFAGTVNSRINIVITGLPSGVKLTWPAASALDSGTGATGASLIKIIQTTAGDTVSYVYHSPNQALSDVNGEKFVITVPAPLSTTTPPGLSLTSADFGSTTGQGQMYDPATTTGSRPRYNHPLEPVPGAPWLTVAPCSTNLLYPWVLNFAGLDTGLAIANTSTDPYGTVAQAGTCTINLYPTDTTTNSGVSAGAGISITTSSIASGSVWRATMSGTSAFTGKAGYIIAVCAFQFGHGFAFITDNFGVGAPATAQGYLANIIPDPKLNANKRTATNVGLGISGGQPPVGEGLGN